MTMITRPLSILLATRKGRLGLVALLICACAAATNSAGRAQGVTDPVSTPTKGALYRDGSTDRYLLGGTWLYRADRSNVGLADGYWRSDASIDGWSPVTVPNAYNAGDFSNASFNGYVGWYRRDFRLPSTGFGIASSKLYWIIRFESVNYRAEVWLNGRLLGSHVGAYLPFELQMSGLQPGVNHLVVRVDNIRTTSSVDPNGAYVDGGPQGAWWNFGGILREVYLRPVVSTDMAQVQVRPILPCPTCTATVQEAVLVRNLSGQRQAVRLRGLYGSRAIDFGSHVLGPRASWNATASVKIPHPRLWSTDHPTLYRASLTLSGSAGKRLAGYVTYSGIRSITVSSDGHLLLNGRRLDLRGVGMQESDVQLGGALDQAHRQRLISWVRRLHATVIRGQYPLHPEIEELADQYGILLWNEIPVFQPTSALLGSSGYLRFAHGMLHDDIEANQNHPSIMLWSVGNELPTPASRNETNYIAGAAKLAHSLDPTRPVGMAASAWPGSGCQSAYKPLNLVGFNDYFGWYDVGGGGTADRDALSPFLDSFRACYPGKALFVSEFGFEANRNGPVEERGTYAFQADSTAFHLGVFAQKPWLSGAIYWDLQDFVLGPGWSGGNPKPDPPFFHKGLIDLYGNFKPAAAVVQSVYGAARQIAPPPR